VTADCRPGTFDRRALARAITRAANASVADALAESAAAAPSVARRIGFTGAPGAGKSTLITNLARLRIACAARLGVIAIDPTSPYTSGAILGDRIRMESVEGEPNLYIRSLASRGARDGLADNLPAILACFDHHAFDEVLLETVGIGQSQTGVRQLVDLVAVVLSPDSGDHVQAMKAGLLEIADLYVVTKDDLPGAQRVSTDLHAVLALRTAPATQPPILVTRQDDPESLAAVSAAIDALFARHVQDADRTHRDRARRRDQARCLIARRCDEVLATLAGEELDGPLADVYRTILRHMAGTADAPDAATAAGATARRLSRLPSDA
jgi:LAO/AO transport system kinase